MHCNALFGLLLFLPVTAYADSAPDTEHPNPLSAVTLSPPTSMEIPTDERQYYPLALSRTWTYKYTKQRVLTAGNEKSVVHRSGTVTEQIVGESEDFDHDDTVFIVSRNIAETAFESRRETKVHSEVQVSVGERGVLLHGTKFTGLTGHSTKLTGHTPPVVLFRLPLDTMPVDQSVREGMFTAKPRPKSQALESISFGAGMFENCLKLEFEGPITGKLPNGISILAGQLSQTVCYAPGVGIVRTIETSEMIREYRG